MHSGADSHHHPVQSTPGLNHMVSPERHDEPERDGHHQCCQGEVEDHPIHDAALLIAEQAIIDGLG